jgi:hypothetical protein
LVVPSGLLPLSFPTKALHALLLSPIRATCPAHLNSIMALGLCQHNTHLYHTSLPWQLPSRHNTSQWMIESNQPHWSRCQSFLHAFFRARLKSDDAILASILGATANLRNATISFIMHVRPSVRMEKLGSHWTDFDEIWHLSFFRKSVDKTQVSLKSDKNNGYFTRRRIDI